uniref:DNA replication ATP-dependent helicase/nuclease n=1 Tax=Anopheles christyi TaxID=43041 RepID=A0A182JR23_9DIPT
MSTWKRCSIVAVQQFENGTIKLTLQDTRSKEKAICQLLPPWNTHNNISPGLIVSVLAVKDSASSDHFVVNADNGFFVTDPDTLVSGTTVVGALFCQRRGVLQELFRTSESENTQMVIGTVAHDIFQRCLSDKSCNALTDVERIAKNVMKKQKVISSLYANNMNVHEACSLLEPYLKQIEIFLNKHVNHDLIQKSTDQITICEINDIEENIWCHHLGVKGRIDATVSVACDSATKKYEIMPLELKTGRANYSFEHLGQIALYEMMMNLVGYKVNAGLLLYLRDGKCSRVTANRNMKRDLIMLRNEVTRSLGRWMVMNEKVNLSKEESLPMKPTLPDPINNERACAKCPYNTVCSTFFKREHEDRLIKDHGFSLVAEETCMHLRNSDVDYFIHWTGLIYLELQASLHSNTEHIIWNSTPEELRMVDDFYFHTFKVDQKSLNATSSEFVTLPETFGAFEVGEYVICSTTKRIAVASGYIISYAAHELVVSFERDLSANYAGENFILDQSTPYRSTTFNLSNLALLLKNADQCLQYRRIIIDRQKPTFSNGILSKSMIPKAKEILKKLNRHQKTAALKAAATESYCLLKGLPGTGKTQTIVGLIRLLSLLGQSILLISNTHSAVDNVLKRLLQFQDLQFLRLGSINRIDPALTSFAESILTEHCDTPEKLAQVYDTFKIVAVTCQGTGHPLINKRLFDYCIVDEATQVFQPSLIRPLLQCKRFLLVGDPEQLPPVVKSDDARSLGASESMFHRLDQEGSFYILPTQYRMNRVLTKLANDFAYNGKLVCGNDIVENSTLSLPNLEKVRRIYEVEKWLMKTISNQIDLSAVIVDTGNTYQMNSNYRKLNEMSTIQTDGLSKSVMKCTNISELAVVVYICWALIQAGVQPESIGVIAPFRAQVDLIRKHLELLFQKQKIPHRTEKKENEDALIKYSCNIEVNTVDQYQGKDKKIIIFSCTKSINIADAVGNNNGEPKDSKDYGILSDKRRLTVAITRAKEKLIFLGDRSTLDSYLPFKKLFQVSSRNSSQFQV